MVDDFARIRSAIRDAARTAWTRLRDERPSESFYYFGLWTTPLAHRPVPTACSEEGLRRAVADGDGDALRWSVMDSPYDLFGDESFARLEPLFEEFGEPYDRPPVMNAALVDAMAGALAELDEEGFFGVGAARDAVVVNVTLPGADDIGAAIESARRLNPPGALLRYERDLRSGSGD
ncbi:DUF4303 domain-containing protein [Leifsonia sp. fls2-241-R2A-40a]|uniref:DUF4303 domain-containing protein n=1 Tax=Leifsonia sp. fls2-241-R2A-40a TaxID=3040290 RepID=UPI00254C34D8|nr:DUF4303 domain-containing protein [Leifsonia sp. fls2-241-R2A-40a]